MKVQDHTALFPKIILCSCPGAQKAFTSHCERGKEILLARGQPDQAHETQWAISLFDLLLSPTLPAASESIRSKLALLLCTVK